LFEETLGIRKAVVHRVRSARGIQNDRGWKGEDMIALQQFRRGRRVNFYYGHIYTVDLLHALERGGL